MPPQKKEPIKLYELTYSTGDTFSPSEKEIEVVSKTFSLFSQARLERDRPFVYFDNMTLISYIEDSTERFNTNLYIRDDMED